MAIAIMGGLLVASVLTLVFLPTLYVTWFRGRDSDAPQSPSTAAPVATKTADETP
jgi:hypothetical protein